MANVQYFDMVINEFEPMLRYYIHFCTNTLGNGMDFLIFPAMDQIVPLLFY